MSPPLSYEKNAYILELQRALKSKDVGKLRLEETFRKYPERMECLFDPRVIWAGADDMELRMAWHVMLRVRPDLLGAFVTKLEEKHPVWWAVVTPETLFEPDLADSVMKGMAQWDPANAAKAIDGVLKQMIRTYVMRPLAVRNASDGSPRPPREWIGQALDHLARLGENVAQRAGEAIIMTVRCCGHNDQESALPVLEALLPHGVDYLNAKSLEGQGEDCVILALEGGFNHVARFLVEGGANWQQAINDSKAGPMARLGLAQCARIRRHNLSQAITPSRLNQKETGRRNKL